MPSNLPIECATYDHGGGVRLGNAFVVYTTNSQHAHPPAIAPRLLNMLATLASTVSRLIKIHYVLPLEPPGILHHSLPHYPPIQPSRLANAFLETGDRPQAPCFFVNASSSREICIAGIEDAVTTLLSVLKRPWCVLELCGAGIEAVEALLAFAEAAKKGSGKDYDGAIALLRHQRWCMDVEEQRRAVLDGFCGFQRLRGRRGRDKKTEIRDIYATLFKSSLESFNNFYMRAIVTCAVVMDVECEAMRNLLTKDAARCHTQMLSKGSVHSHRKIKIDTKKQLDLGETLDALLDSQQKRQLRDVVYHENLTTQTPVDKNVAVFGHDTEEALIELYKDVLEYLAFNIA